MRTYFFDLVVDRDLTGETDSDRMFEAFSGDVTPAVTNGAPMLLCSVEADSLVDALRATIERLKEEGVRVLRVEMEPDAVDA